MWGSKTEFTSFLVLGTTCNSQPI